MTEPVVNTEKTTGSETKEKKSIMNIEMPPPATSKVAKRFIYVIMGEYTLIFENKSIFKLSILK